MLSRRRDAADRPPDADQLLYRRQSPVRPRSVAAAADESYVVEADMRLRLVS